ncbi:MAG: hypothetical protein A2Z88_01160 [Omnitrophica WOR_2 bacterium GWA2_47_8]|nr:MAG: hypothetical protein A2Z88_01160 [Omnitrophica WOR_2 bacterium GWA2_47_8]
MMFAKAQNKELETFAQILSQSVIALFQERGQASFSQPPKLEQKNIYEYEGRMRVDGMEKFNNEATYISAVNYYLNAADMAKHKAIGVVVVYVPQDYLAKMMKTLQYPLFDDDNDDALRDSCGTLCNIIAGRFKSDMKAAGYQELEMSPFINFRNSSFSGVEFCGSEFQKYDLNFFLENNQKKMVIELSIGIVPKR